MKDFEKFFYWFCFEQYEFGTKKIPNGGPKVWVRWSNGDPVTFDELYKQYLTDKNLNR